MSDYVVTTDFSVKDGLTTGDPEKIILGADVDVEFDAIAVASATKYDVGDLASQAQAEAEALNTVLMTPLRVANWADFNAGIVGDLQAITAPGADRVLGFDQTTATAIGFTLGPGLAFNGTAIDMDALGLEDLAAPGADRIYFYDQSGTAANFATLGTGLQLVTTTFSVDESALTIANFSDAATRGVDHSGVQIATAATSGLSGGGTISATRNLSIDWSRLTAFTGDAVDLDVDSVAIVDGGGSTMREATINELLTPEAPAVVSGTTDTLAETDFGKLVQYSSTSTVTITLPNGLKTGFWAVLQKTGASGSTNITATTTLNTVNSLTSMLDQYAAVTVFHTGSNIWTAWGNLV